MRTSRAIAVALLVALAPITISHPARSQGAAEDPTTAMARARFKEGVEFYDKGEFEQARVSFLQAYALKKHPTLLLNLAWSCLKSGHPLEADRYFKQFLAEGREITDKQRADAHDGLAQSRAKLGRIEVVAGAGTEVTVDGDRVGNAPLGDPVAVEAGAHTVKVKGSDGTTETQSITVMGGERAVARFKGAAITPAAVVPAAPAVVPLPAPEATAPPATPAPPLPRPPPEEVSHRTSRPPATVTAEPEGNGPFDAPRNLLPVFLLGGAAVLGYGGAALFLYFKGQAQNKADEVASSILGAGGSCPPTPGDTARFGASCDAWNTDNGQVNDDALWGNVALGVGIAATAGAIVYWLVAEKGEPSHRRAKPMLAPMVGPTARGVSLSGAF
jgi:Tfp pilus assembly protein PilF